MSAAPATATSSTTATHIPIVQNAKVQALIQLDPWLAPHHEVLAKR
jgi:hypothetical protein